MTFKLSAQVCNGSLGDPIIKEDFGAVSPQFPNTTYTYVGTSCPEDGQYALVKQESGCHPDTWYSVLKDHTGNGGYMMLVNASYDTGEFYRKSTDIELCGETTYEFSAYIKNLVLPSAASTHNKPNITFVIETVNGAQLKSYSTGPIYETTSADEWVKYGTYFTTPAGGAKVVVRMINNAPGGAGNDLLLDDIAFRACGPIVQANFTGGSAPSTQEDLCVGETGSYTITATPSSGYDQPEYQWQKNYNDGNGWVDISGENGLMLNITLTNAQLGSYQYRLGTAEAGNISSVNCRVYSNEVTVGVTAYPVIPTIAAQTKCEGDPLVLTAGGGVNYEWTLPDGSKNTANPLTIAALTLANKGQYNVKVISAQGCSTEATTQVNVIAKPQPQITVGETSICKGSSTVLTVNSPGAVSYQWAPAEGLSDATSANPVASPAQTTTYTVTVTNASQCINTAQVQIEVRDVPVANAGDDKKIFEGQSVVLNGSATGDVAGYSWSPASYLDNPNSLTPTANPPNDITYKLTVTSANGCGIDDSDVFIRVFKKIVIPSTFTPNSDGVNDLWNIEALETYPESVLAVYTRNGKQVFQSRGYSRPWDGKSSGQALPAGTYYYVIDLKNGTPKMSGWVMILK
ncbi:gliding motility-associated C-terminal domain-containing protein [Mucilaginibacter litoreus]